MDYKEIESKWQKYWADNKVYSFNKDRVDKIYYLLEMFSYPSGAKLHLGHWWNYGLCDSFGRFKRMQGYEVFQPMGFDAFGLPAENYAIKTGIHPQDSTMKNIAVMEEQLKKMGATFDWDYEIKTCCDDYYKWTQWLFLKLYEHGLAYQKWAPVNWCPSCNTVLANEQVVDGKCERCGSEVTHKSLTQWFFKITDYADRLLKDHDKIDWPDKTITLQKNWIDKSVGGEIILDIDGKDFQIATFTTRADTLYGVTFIVVAPEHPMLEKLTTDDQREQVEQYVKNAKAKSEIDRSSSKSEKTGVFTGSYAINPLTNEKVPVFVGDYVIGSYGTGAVIGVGAHDARDYDFAKKLGLSVKKVITNKEDNVELPYCEKGILTNSGEFNGLDSNTAIDKILTKLQSIGHGNKKVNYRLRDWSVSRQRYWGCPIPMIHCDHCGTVPVPEKDLPVRLPYEVDWTPKGTSPLASIDSYMQTTCPKCGGKAHRDPDTLDTFVCSSWYFLRYPNAQNSEKAFDSDWTNKMLPVDKYVGGIEHACGHLLYSRFITKFLYDIGYINFDEPFLSLVHQGLILGSDGVKMSKSRGNTVSADDLIQTYGSDTLRMYLMFGFNYLEGGPWSDDGIVAMSKFVDRLVRIVENIANLPDCDKKPYDSDEKELDYVLNKTIKCVSTDMENFSFNTAVARIMELTNALYKYYGKTDKNVELLKEVAKKLNLLIAPMIPHIAEELFTNFNNDHIRSIFDMPYPVCDESKLTLDEVEIVAQINNKIICKLNVPTDANNDVIDKLARANDKIRELLDGKNVVKTIVVKNRLINYIAR